LFVGPHRVRTHHIGPVGEVGNAAESLCLALGAQVAGRLVESRELRVCGGLDRDGRGECEGARGRREQRQALLGQLVVLALRERRVVERERLEREVLTCGSGWR